MQQQSLTNEQIREFVIAGHGNLAKIKQMLAERPELLNVTYQSNENDRETAIQAAAQVGNVSIAEYLLEKGAPLETCTLAMLGREAELKHRLEKDPKSAMAVGAHSIPLLPHAVWSGNLELVKLVYNKGATEGANLALHNALSKGNYEIVSWLLDNARPDVSAKNYQGKTPLTIAREREDERIVQLLKNHGAME
jgi:uncharacterized protein